MPFSFEKNNIFPVIYILILVVLGVSSFFTDARLWGVNIWGYFPDYISPILFVVGALALIFVKFRDKGQRSKPVSAGLNSNGKKFLIWVLPISLVLAVSFVLLKGQTFFLGDGYQIISLLAEDNYVKSRELGESLIHLWAVKAFSLTGNQGAQLSYQWLSIIAGVCYLVLTALFSRRLFDNTVDRTLFFLGAISGGYMLLFFGYVENYTFFVLSVALYTMAGLLIVRGIMNRWWLVLFLALPMFFHILGLILIPSAVYLLVVNTKTGKRLSEINLWFKRFIALGVVIIIFSVFVYFYQNDYFFRFAIVPIAEDRFTIENYTMFSLEHVLDFFNLLMLMLPAFPFMAALLISLSGRKIFRRKEYRYLAILLLSALSAVFIFDPKLGMPRDWDLFSFAGVPLVIGFFFLLIDYEKKIKNCKKVAILSVLLGFLVLFPRAFIQSSPSMALDRVKNRNVHYLIYKYYDEKGDTALADEELTLWESGFPEKELIKQAKMLRNAGQWEKAIILLKRVIAVNPHYSDAWSNLGEAYMTLKKYDSAVYFCQIANGLNPNVSEILTNLGAGYMYLNKLDKAEKLLKRAMKLDTTLYETPYNLAYIYYKQGRYDRYIEMLVKAGSKKNANWVVYKEIGQELARRGDFVRARKSFNMALTKGMDSTHLIEIVKKYPRLLNDEGTHNSP